MEEVCRKPRQLLPHSLVTSPPAVHTQLGVWVMSAVHNTLCIQSAVHKQIYACTQSVVL